MAQKAIVHTISKEEKNKSPAAFFLPGKGKSCSTNCKIGNGGKNKKNLHKILQKGLHFNAVVLYYVRILENLQK